MLKTLIVIDMEKPSLICMPTWVDSDILALNWTDPLTNLTNYKL